MAQMDWHEIADRHKISDPERREFFFHVNTLGFALSGNVTPTLAQGPGALMDLPVQRPGPTGVQNGTFRDIYLDASPTLQAAIDDLLLAYRQWLKLQ